MNELKDILEPYEQAIDLIHRASLYLEMAFRRTQDALLRTHDDLRMAQCELPLNQKHGAKLQASQICINKSQDFIQESLGKIYCIQETCAEIKKLCTHPGSIPKNGR